MMAPHRRPVMGFLALALGSVSVSGCVGVIDDTTSAPPRTDPVTPGEPGGSTGSGNGWGSGGVGVGGAGGARSAKPVQPGPAPWRRLTRTEYNNTIRDLLLDDSKPGSGFPGDALGHGFDNNAYALVVTTALADDYLTAAEQIASRAVATIGTKSAALLPCTPSAGTEDTCARAFITSFGQRAYRRPLVDTEVTGLMAQYQAGKALGDFQTGIRLTLTRMLQAPPFLYRIDVGEPTAKPDRRALTSWEVASRLSYFLWSTMPDAPLFQAAEANALRTPQQIADHARRMLQDPRARPVVAAFHEQWLELGKIANTEKDPAAYPNFPKVRAFMKEEATRFMEGTFWQGDGDARKIFTSTSSFMNPELAVFLEMPGAAALKPGFQLVALDTTQRLGLLTMSGMIAAKAKRNETFPVLQGKFILEKLLCVDIPPADPNVVNNLPKDIPGQTTREKYTKHAKAECASCHRMMDPLGFAFEHFDAVGRWRTTDQGKPVDSTGAIVGTDVDGPFEGAVDVGRMVAGSEQGRRCLATNWFRYAYGRGELPVDEGTIDDLGRRFTAANFNMRELLIAITQSDAFVYRPAL